MEIGKKIYYDKATGNIHTITPEMSGSVVETTIEQDFITYTALHGIDPTTVGVIQLGYGQYAIEFTQYIPRVDPITKSLVWDVPRTLSLDEAKKRKLAQLEQFKDADIYSSFQSSALGSLKTYNYSTKAAQNFKDKAIILSLSPNITTVKWYTLEDGFIDHTRDQFIQVITDGANHQETLEMKYFQLEAQANIATTIDEVNVITW